MTKQDRLAQYFNTYINMNTVPQDIEELLLKYRGTLNYMEKQNNNKTKYKKKIRRHRKHNKLHNTSQQITQRIKATTITKKMRATAANHYEVVCGLELVRIRWLAEHIDWTQYPQYQTGMRQLYEQADLNEGLYHNKIWWRYIGSLRKDMNDPNHPLYDEFKILRQHVQGIVTEDQHPKHNILRHERYNKEPRSYFKTRVLMDMSTARKAGYIYWYNELNNLVSYK